MPHLDLRNTPAGPRYFLDEQPLSNNELIEVRSERLVTETGWLAGKFRWTGEIGDRPYIYNAHSGQVIETGAEVRRVKVEPAKAVVKKPAAKNTSVKKPSVKKTPAKKRPGKK